MRQLKFLKKEKTMVLSVEEKNLWNQVRSNSNFSEFKDSEINFLFQIAKQYDNEKISFDAILDAGKEGMLKAKTKLSAKLKPHKKTDMIAAFIRHTIVEKINTED